MKKSNLLLLVICLIFALATPFMGQDAANDKTETRQETIPEPQAFLKSLVGTWEGTCRTWFRPAALTPRPVV